MRDRLLILPAALTALLCACNKDPIGEEPLVDEPFILQLPPGAPPPLIPADLPFTHASVTLGKKLFFEKRLSGDGSLACAGCHLTDHAFSDTLALSLGVQGGQGFRNAPSLANLAYHPAYFRDGGVPSLELQVLAPIHDQEEMASNINDVAALLRGEEPYASLSHTAYGRDLDAFVITRAIASYERTLISGWSRFDRFLYQNDPAALTDEERTGWQFFSGPEAGCTDCHGGFDLSDHSYQNIGTSLDHASDPGRQRITLLEEDRGKFKVPTLRNVALTGPYMHDGSMATLEQVLDHFASGGLPDPNRSPLMHPFTLSAQDRSNLIAFLHALTDERSLDPLP